MNIVQNFKTIWDEVNAVHEGGGGAVVLTALVGLLAYLANQLVMTISTLRDARRRRRARLIELQSLLAASRVSFLIQAEHRDLLEAEIRKNHSRTAEEIGYDGLFSAVYPTFTTEEKTLHDLIRGITIYSLKPTNEALMKWLDNDNYFRGRSNSWGRRRRLARSLAHLQAHLVIWRAKFYVWILARPEHSLVYMDDENRHGLGFPKDLETLVESILHNRPITG